MARSQKKTKDKHVISRLTDAGEGAVQRLGELPGGKSLLRAFSDMLARLDETSTKVRKLDPLERRVAAIEKRLNALEKPKARDDPEEDDQAQARRSGKHGEPGDAGAGGAGGRARANARVGIRPAGVELAREHAGAAPAERRRTGPASSRAARRRTRPASGTAASTVTDAPRSSSARGCGRCVPR